jgi:signal peptidase I
VKRVAAVGGDTVEPGPDNSVLVNGEAVKVPGACGYPIRSGDIPHEAIPVEAFTVPRDSFFVIGDNLSQSFDSRFSNFGLVKRDQVRGKALFIYWSAGKSRIGCSIR